MNLLPAIVIDTETTGFPGRPWTCLVELGAVALDAQGNTMSTFESLVRPTILDARCLPALKVNHLDPNELRQAPTVSTVWRAWCEWASMQAAPGSGITSWQLTFEKKILEGTYGFGRIPWSPFCVKQEAVSRLPVGRKRTSLAKMVAHLNLPQHQPAHRALADALTAADILVAIAAGKLGPKL